MRNMIFFSFIAITVSNQVVAEVDLESGCYARHYDTRHLAEHPDQIVERIVIRVDAPPVDQPPDMDLAVWTANQGHVVSTGNQNRRFDQWLLCWSEAEKTLCGVECDAGVAHIQRADRDILQFTTNHLWVGEAEGCGGAVNLAEHTGQSVAYRLERVSDTICTQTFRR